MILNLDQAERICSVLRTTRPFVDLPVTNRPVTDLWSALDSCLMTLRMPLYHKRLRKPPPKPVVYANGVQAGLALVGAFAAGFGTHQAIVSSKDGWIDRISFQPRPESMNWTASHAISPQALVHRSPISYEVSIEDFLHLAAKVVYAVVAANAGAIPDVTATYAFRHTDETILVDLVVRELDGQSHRASLKA
jgi:hypothetical protein